MEKVPRLVEAMNENGATPLYAAACKGSYDAAELLIKKVNIQMGTATHYATRLR